MISCTDCSENPAKFSSVCFCAKTKVRAKFNVWLFSEVTTDLLRAGAGADLHQSHVSKAFPLLQQVGGGDGGVVGGGRGGRGLGGHC